MFLLILEGERWTMSSISDFMWEQPVDTKPLLKSWGGLYITKKQQYGSVHQNFLCLFSSEKQNKGFTTVHGKTLEHLPWRLSYILRSSLERSLGRTIGIGSDSLKCRRKFGFCCRQWQWQGAGGLGSGFCWNPEVEVAVVMVYYTSMVRHGFLLLVENCFSMRFVQVVYV